MGVSYCVMVQHESYPVPIPHHRWEPPSGNTNPSSSQFIGSGSPILQPAQPAVTAPSYPLLANTPLPSLKRMTMMMVNSATHRQPKSPTSLSLHRTSPVPSNDTSPISRPPSRRARRRHVRLRWSWRNRRKARARVLHRRNYWLLCRGEMRSGLGWVSGSLRRHWSLEKRREEFGVSGIIGGKFVGKRRLGEGK